IMLRKFLPLALLCGGCDTVLLADNFDSWPANYRQGPIPGDPVGDEVFIPRLVGGGVPAAVAGPRLWFGGFERCEAPTCDAVFTSAPITEDRSGDPMELMVGFDRLFANRSSRIRITVRNDDGSPLFYIRIPGDTLATQIIHGGGVEESGRGFGVDEPDQIVIIPDDDGGSAIAFGRTFPLMHGVGNRIQVAVGYEGPGGGISRLYELQLRI